jgi:hypothetical protein
MKAKHGWLGLVGYVIAVDGWLILKGRQTLSSAFYEAVRHPRRRWPVILAWAYLTLHLFGRTAWLERHLTWKRR